MTDAYEHCKQNIWEHGDGGCCTALLATMATSCLLVMPKALSFPMALPYGDNPSSTALSPLAFGGSWLFLAMPLLLQPHVPVRTNK